jgi:hypothetical protein
VWLLGGKGREEEKKGKPRIVFKGIQYSFSNSFYALGRKTIIV